MGLTNSVAAAIFTGGLLEGFGIPWPGALVLAGAAARMTAGAGAVPLAAALYTGGYVLGALVQYLIGRTLGRRALRWLPDTYRTRLESLTARYGPRAVILLRPFLVGNYVSIPAGIAKMPVSRFAVYTGLGIGPWATGLALAGWLVGHKLTVVNEAIIPWLLPAAIALGLITTLGLVFRRWYGGNAASPDSGD